MTRKWYSYLVKENVWGLLTQSASFLGGLAFALIFPNLLGAEGFGVYALAIAVAHFWLFFADLGITYATPFISAGLRDGSSHLYFHLLAKWKLVLTAVAPPALFLFSDVLATYVYPGYPPLAFRLAAVYLFFLSPFNFLDNSFVAVQRAKYSFTVTIAYQALRVLLPLILFYSVSRSYEAVLGGTAAAMALSSALAILLAMMTPQFAREKGGRIDSLRLRSYVAYGALAYLAGSLLQTSDVLVIGLTQSSAAIGYYKVAMMWVIATTLFFPISSRVLTFAHAFEEKVRSRRMFEFSVKYGIVFAFLVIAGVLLLGLPLLRLVYGDAFLPAFPVLAVLSLLSLQFVFNTASGGVLVGRGRIGAFTGVLLASSAAQAVLAYLATPALGIVGTALSVVAAQLGGSMVLAAQAVRLVGAEIRPEWLWRPFLAALMTFAVLAPIVPLAQGPVLTLALVLAMAIAYVLACLLIGAAELEEMRRVLSSILR